MHSALAVTPAVDLEGVQPHAGVGIHRVGDVLALVADRLEGGPREWALVLKRLIPTMAPRASERQ
jgi:hypothetical protein